MLRYTHRGCVDNMATTVGAEVECTLGQQRSCSAWRGAPVEDRDRVLLHAAGRPVSPCFGCTCNNSSAISDVAANSAHAPHVRSHLPIRIRTAAVLLVASRYNRAYEPDRTTSVNSSKSMDLSVAYEVVHLFSSTR